MDTSIVANVMLDFPAGWFFFYWGGYAMLVLLLLVIVLLEAGVLHKLGVLSWPRALRTSLLINLASTVLGYVAAMQIEPLQESRPDYYAGIEEIVNWRLFSETAVLPGVPLILLFLFVSLLLSLASEGLVLHLLHRDRSWRNVWFLTFSANAASYALLLLISLWPPLINGAITVLLRIIFGAMEYWGVSFILLVLLIYAAVEIRKSIRSHADAPE